MCGSLRWSSWWAGGWIVGIWLGSMGWFPFPFLAALCLMALVAGGWWVYRRWSGFRLLFVAASFLAAAAYMTWVDDHNRSVWTEAASLKGELAGTIASPPDIDGNRVHIELASKTWEDGGTVFSTGGERVLLRLYLMQEQELAEVRQFRRGDRVQVAVELERPRGKRNPGGFDYRAYLYRQHIHWIGHVSSLDDLEWLSSSVHWLRPLDRFRDYLGERMGTVYDKPAAGLVRGMILGERQAVDVQVEREFATLGLLHLLAISGLHVGVVLALCYGGLKQLGMTREKAAAIALLFLPFYALLTGAAPPVIRASIVSAFVLFAVIFRQWKDSVHFLALAAVIMLLWNPYWLFTASFQLSFFVSLGILVGVPVVSAMIPWGPMWLRQTVAVTLVAQLCSFPLLIYYFNQFSLLSVLANLFIVPFVSVVVIPLSFITVILAAVAVPLAFLPAGANALMIDFVLTASNQFAAWETLHLVWATPSRMWIGAYFALLAASIYLFRRRRFLYFYRLAWAAWLFAFAMLIVIAYYPAPWWNRPLTVTFLDVGQGDAIVIETPKRQTIVMDAGGTPFFTQEPWQEQRDPFDVGEDIVLPFLRHKGIRTIDFLIMSHGDADHIGGMPALVEHIPIRHFLRGPDTHEPSVVEEDLITSLHLADVPIHRATSGTGWEVEDGVYWQFIQPEPDQVAPSDRNAQSLVLYMMYRGRTIVLTGDADQAVEEQMIETWKLPPIDVLKAGHHGSDTPTGEKWLEAIQPKVTILSAGENNRYNHPHPAVIERLERAGSRIYRTDRQGAIVVRIDGEGRMDIEPTIFE